MRDPNPAPALAPALVSQLTSIAILGIDERRFLDRVVPLCRPHVTRFGKLRLIPIDVAVAKLRELADGDEAVNPTVAANDGAASEPRTVDEVLARVGHRRVAR